MPDETLEEFVVTKGVTEIYLVNAKDAKDAEAAVEIGNAVLIQRKTSSNAQPKPEAPTGDTQATHASLQAAVRGTNQPAPKPSG